MSDVWLNLMMTVYIGRLCACDYVLCFVSFAILIKWRIFFLWERKFEYFGTLAISKRERERKEWKETKEIHPKRTAYDCLSNQLEACTLRRLTFKCKIENKSCYVSYIHTIHTKRTVPDLLNVCKNHTALKLRWARIYFLKMQFHHSDTSVTLTQGEGHQTWHELAHPKQWRLS